jgi:predicted nucleic acid-binding Zn ribbon protein
VTGPTDILRRSMPTYVYKFVDTGETIEVQQAFTDDALTEAEHPTTGEVRPVKKVFTPVGVTFKGGGFYKNDSRSGTGSRSSSTKGSSEGDSSGGSDTSSSSSTGGSGSSDKGSTGESKASSSTTSSSTSSSD